MKLSPIPDLGAGRRLAWTALVVTLFASTALLWWNAADLSRTLGDTDDAMRLVLVRDLMNGRGWWDQWVGRLQPPLGTYMHWSRLLDGVLAGLTFAFRLVLSPAAAEMATRTCWPLMLIFPAALCALAIARRLGGPAAVLICAVLLVCNPQIYAQFRPGRVDHHNVQIVMTLIAAACATAGEQRTRWAALAGAATAFGLCIGIEALAFQALIGASYGLRATLDPDEAPAARNYGLSLSLATLAFFGLQTPPWRWSLGFCDAIGVNLVAGLVAAGLGLAAVAVLARRSSTPVRFAGLAAVGVLAGGLYLLIDPACIRGPLGAVDPRVQSLWAAHTLEIESWPELLKTYPGAAVLSITAAAMTSAACLFLTVRDGRSAHPDVLLIAACTLLAAVAASQAFRMQDYVFWLGFPALAAAFGAIANRWLSGFLLPTLAASFLLSPVFVGLAAADAAQLVAPNHVRAAGSGIDDHCFDTAVYRPLAALPPGLVLGEVDLGPFILAHTGDSVVAGPYHRLTWGILAAHDALNASDAAAEAKVRALKADYLVECPTNKLRVGPHSFEADLRRGRVPAWLQPLSKPGQTLQIYRVEPPAPARP
jgi:hypothetical protein